MRLLHARTLEFEVFHDDQIPQYVILSHTWGDEEVSYQEMRFLQQYNALPAELEEDIIFVAAMKMSVGLDILLDSRAIESRTGYSKIQEMANIAREKGMDYFWIDTCCIDKSSSAELQEAINSMYRWYQHSSFCAVHLEGVDITHYKSWGGMIDLATILQPCKWITRGWTLQELIAPRNLAFYDGNFTCIEAWRMYNGLERATGVSEYVLRTGDLSRSSVAQKMSWAATRKTTRIEDRAYSLMGLFGVQIPMLYGEGENAFSRLQEEIIRTTPDDSIFAWRATWGLTSSYCGLLAKSPDVFEQSQSVDRGRSTFAMSNMGLKIDAPLSLEIVSPEQLRNWRVPGHKGSDPIRLLLLDAEQYGRSIGLFVRRLEANFYARVAPNIFEHSKMSKLKLETLYFEDPPRIPRKLMSCAMYCFHFEFDQSEYSISSARPRGLWDQDRQELSIEIAPGGNDFSPYNTFHGMVWMTCHKPGFTLPFSIFIAYHVVTGRLWTKLLSSDYTPREIEWHTAISDTEISRRYEESSSPDTSQELQLPCGVLVEINIRAGLRRGLISYIVRIS